LELLLCSPTSSDLLLVCCLLCFRVLFLLVAVLAHFGELLWFLHLVLEEEEEEDEVCLCFSLPLFLEPAGSTSSGASYSSSPSSLMVLGESTSVKNILMSKAKIPINRILTYIG
jgi:hypothetical protein